MNRAFGTPCILTAVTIGLCAAAPFARAVNVIVNGGFETPFTGIPGNNFVNDLPGWTLVLDPGSAPCGVGHNVILGSVGYGGGPDAAVDGVQYYDICGAAGYIYQAFTIGSASTVSFGASFSRRDTESGGGSTDIFDSTNTTLLFSSPFVSVDAGESQEIWRVSNGTIPSLAPGSYIMRVNIQNPANADAVFLDVTPVPEPGSALLLAGAFAAGMARRRK